MGRPWAAPPPPRPTAPHRPSSPASCLLGQTDRENGGLVRHRANFEGHAPLPHPPPPYSTAPTRAPYGPAGQMKRAPAFGNHVRDLRFAQASRERRRAREGEGERTANRERAQAVGTRNQEPCCRAASGVQLVFQSDRQTQVPVPVSSQSHSSPIPVPSGRPRSSHYPSE